jgi:hypothetical protein
MGFEKVWIVVNRCKSETPLPEFAPLIWLLHTLQIITQMFACVNENAS